MPWNPGVSYHGDQYAFQGLTNAGNILGADLQKALSKYEEDKKQREFNTGILDTFKQDPHMSKFVPVDALERWDSLNGDKQAGIIAGVTRRASSDIQQQQLDRQNQESEAKTNLLWAQGNNEWSGTGPGGTGDVLNLSPADQANYDKAGKIPVRTSAKSFQAADMPEAPAPPDLDGSGNPIFTKDGTMYRSKGEFKPVTGPMMQAKQTFDAMQKANGDAAAALKKQPGFSVFHPTTWWGSQPAAAAAPAGGNGLPADPGMTPGAPSLMPAQAPQQQQAAAAIKAKFAAGQLTKDDAIKQLQALGFQ